MIKLEGHQIEISGSNTEIAVDLTMIIHYVDKVFKKHMSEYDSKMIIAECGRAAFEFEPDAYGKEILEHDN